MPATRKNRKGAKGAKGWKKLCPGTHQRTVMLNKCGQKCFLGPHKSFPICSKNTCKVNSKGVYAAYMRARQYSSKGQKYRNIAKKANHKLIKMGLRLP